MPRLSDAVGKFLRLINEHGPTGWEAAVFDFSDAFKQVRVDPKEYKHLAGRALDGYFHYTTIMFGVKSGPHLWGRNVALLMRLTAAMARK